MFIHCCSFHICKPYERLETELTPVIISVTALFEELQHCQLVYTLRLLLANGEHFASFT